MFCNHNFPNNRKRLDQDVHDTYVMQHPNASVFYVSEDFIFIFFSFGLSYLNSPTVIYILLYKSKNANTVTTEPSTLLIWFRVYNSWLCDRISDRLSLWKTFMYGKDYDRSVNLKQITTLENFFDNLFKKNYYRQFFHYEKRVTWERVLSVNYL